MPTDRIQLGRKIAETYDRWLAAARAGKLEPEQLEDYNSPACIEYTRDEELQRACVECPLEGPICEAIQAAYNALYADQDPVPPLTTGKALLGPSLARWRDSEEVPA